MHTEEIRVRLAARNFRSLVSGGQNTRNWSSEEILRAADAYTGFTRITLPEDDPLLVGGCALLDRDFQTIWLSAARSRDQQFLDAAHEYGHIILHSPAPGDQCELLPMETVGYSKNQRDEVDAHRFAAEFLLPADFARERILAGEKASSLSQELSVPYQTVVQQLCVVGSNELLTSSQARVKTSLDNWQRDALMSDTSSLVVGAPGTGKTAVLLAKIDHLINYDDVIPYKILIVADSDRSANEIRRKLILSGDPKASIVPVTSPHRLAYDLLVRFPKAAGLSHGWEERTHASKDHPMPDAKDFLSLALRVLEQEPGVVGSLRSRYSHFLVDNLDEAGSESLKLLIEVVPKSKTGFWGTATEIPMSFGSEAPWTKVYDLRFQYRYAQNIQKFTEQLGPTKRSLAVCRREKSERCAIGSVAVAIAQNGDQILAGISDFIHQMCERGYTAPDIQILMKPGADSRDVAWSDELRTQLNSSIALEDNGRQAKELLAFVKLCCGGSSRRDYIRAGQALRYGMPFNDLLSPSLPQSPSFSLLQTDIEACRSAGKPRAILARYLFEQTDYLRANPQSIEAALALMAKLSLLHDGLSAGEQMAALERIQRELDNTETEDVVTEGKSPRIVTYNRLRTNLTPIVIVPNVSLDQFTSLFEQRTASRSLLHDASLLATDHVLFCTLSNRAGGDIIRLQRMASKSSAFTVIDWTRNQQTQEKQLETNRLPILLSTADRALFQQCPRRVYYKSLLENKAEKMVPARYPATPADRGFCTSCRYVEICPET